jgi:hypothetical protein
MPTTGTLFTYAPGAGRVVAAKSYAIAPYTLGNVTIVDGVNGVDATGVIGGAPYKTVQAAVAALTTASATGYTVWIQPGTYTLASGLTLPTGTVLKGSSAQNTTLVYSPTATATMITMAESCRVEDLTLNLTPTGAGLTTDSQTYKGVVFGGTSSMTSSIRNCILTVNNSTVAATLTSTVTGVEFSGTGSLSSATFSNNSLKATTVTVKSSGKGNKRGILVSSSNQVSTRECNIYVTAPTNVPSTSASYVGVETNDSSNTGSIQLRATTVSCGTPSTTPYTASDILQTSPATFTNPTYLSSSGIQFGPGSGLVTKTAGTLGFSTYLYPTIVTYNLTGNVKDNSTARTGPGYLSPYTTVVSSSAYPYSSSSTSYFMVPQTALLAGMSVALSTGASSTYTVTVTVTNGSNSTGFALTLTGTTTLASMYNKSSLFNAGDKLNVSLTYTGAASNTAQNLVVQLYLI